MFRPEIVLVQLLLKECGFKPWTRATIIYLLDERHSIQFTTDIETARKWK